MEQKKPSPIFCDLDDTLVMNTAFTDAKHAFFSRLQQEGFCTTRADEILLEREMINVEIGGFGKDRLPKSFVEAYQHLCAERGIPQDAHLRWQLEGIAWSVFDVPSVTMEGVLETLSSLRERGHPLYVVTKGDHELQHLKVQRSGFAHLLDGVFVYPNKTEKEIAHAVAEAGYSIPESWFVGNSCKSDINPSLRLGMKAVYIPFSTWKYEEEELLDGYVEIPHISHLPRIIN